MLSDDLFLNGCLLPYFLSNGSCWHSRPCCSTRPGLLLEQIVRYMHHATGNVHCDGVVCGGEEYVKGKVHPKMKVSYLLEFGTLSRISERPRCMR